MQSDNMSSYEYVSVRYQISFYKIERDDNFVNTKVIDTNCTQTTWADGMGSANVSLSGITI